MVDSGAGAGSDTVVVVVSVEGVVSDTGADTTSEFAVDVVVPDDCTVVETGSDVVVTGATAESVEVEVVFVDVIVTLVLPVGAVVCATGGLLVVVCAVLGASVVHAPNRLSHSPFLIWTQKTWPVATSLISRPFETATVCASTRSV